MSIMFKFIQVCGCLFCAYIVFLAEFIAFTNESIDLNVREALILGVAVIGSVIVLQIQTYNYLVPNSLRSKLRSSRPNYDRDSFFKGTIGLGYLFVIGHLGALFTEYQSAGGIVLGSYLILFGTLSKVKTGISIGLSCKTNGS